MTSPKRILFISNGHGEDAIAGKLIDKFREVSSTDFEIHAWPMVGHGQAYQERRVPLVGAQNTLPSGGFASLNWRLMIRDLCAGFIPTHWRQIRAARAMRGIYDLAVAVGDVVVIAAAVLSRTPFLFVGSAKSSYLKGLHGYTVLEKRLLRKHCLLAFPRDSLTAEEMNRAGIRTRYVGNPTMDGLEGTGETFDIPPKATVIAFLPGSRADTRDNILDLLAGASTVAELSDIPSPVFFLFAAHSELDMPSVLHDIRTSPRARSWRINDDSACEPAADGVTSRLSHPTGATALFIKRRFADVLRCSTLAVGMAGNANEQAVGLGLPLIAIPARGLQGKNFVEMKMQLFGQSAVAVPNRPEAIARVIAQLLGDVALRGRMAQVGQERMGLPGASEAIAGEILNILERRRGTKA